MKGVKCLPRPGRRIDCERALNGAKKIHFIIGGAFGVNDELRKRADLVWQFIATGFSAPTGPADPGGQVYRACTILKNEKYHHFLKSQITHHTSQITHHRSEHIFNH
jgi:hypothetical protein